MNIDFVILSTQVLSKSLEKVSQGLARRFTHKLPTGVSKHPFGDGFVEVTPTEVVDIIRLLPASALGPDGITTGMLKVLFDYAPHPTKYGTFFSQKFLGSKKVEPKVMPPLKQEKLLDLT